MGELFNLRRVRKQIARERAEKQADHNRIKFGRSKSERDLDAMTSNRAAELLEQHRITGEDQTS